MHKSFEQELESLLNKFSEDRYSNTPDFILARFMKQSLESFNAAVNWRDQWYGIAPAPGTNWLDTAIDKRKKIDGEGNAR